MGEEPSIAYETSSPQQTEYTKTSPSEYLQTSTDYKQLSPEPTYHKESEPSTSEFYPKPSPEYPTVTSGPTYYRQNDENSSKREDMENNHNEDEKEILTKIDELQGKLQKLQDDIENYLNHE